MTGVQTCALPIFSIPSRSRRPQPSHPSPPQQATSTIPAPSLFCRTNIGEIQGDGDVDIGINLAKLDPGIPGPRAAVVLDVVAVSSHWRETRGLSRAYPGGSTVCTTCTASCWPLTASSWSTATPRLQLGGIEKRPVFLCSNFLLLPFDCWWTCDFVVVRAG